MHLFPCVLWLILCLHWKPGQGCVFVLLVFSYLSVQFLMLLRTKQLFTITPPDADLYQSNLERILKWMWIFPWIFIHLLVLIIFSWNMWFSQHMKIYRVFPKLAELISRKIFLIEFLSPVLQNYNKWIILIKFKSELYFF